MVNSLSILYHLIEINVVYIVHRMTCVHWVKTIAQIFTDKILYCFLGQSIKGKKIEAKSLT